MRRSLIGVCAALLLASCAVGPNYQRPPVEAAPAFKEDSGWKPSEPRPLVDDLQ